MMSRYFDCEYDAMPSNYKNWMPSKYADRFNRLKDGTKLWNLRSEERPMLIILHLFGDDSSSLTHWLDMLYQLAAPESFGKRFEFFVDDLFAAHIFDWHGYVHRAETFPMQSPPLIYGVSGAGEVHFFGNDQGPDIPNFENLNEFCKQLLEESLIPLPGYKELVKVPDVDLSNLNECIYGDYEHDIVIFFYNLERNGIPETQKYFQDFERHAAKLQQEQVQIFKMNLQRNNPPKKFCVETTPALIMLRRVEKDKPIRCCDISRGLSVLVKFVAQHSTEELLYYDRRGNPKPHGHLLRTMRNSFKNLWLHSLY